jgi:GDP-L-fucose synthase
MPTNLYGPNDNYDLQTSHVIPALLRKFHEAKVENASVVNVWGSGSPLREFMHVDDMADACLFLMNNYDDKQFVNVASGQELTIKELAELIKEVVDFKGEISWDKTKPDGTPRKRMDTSKLDSRNWRPKISLKDGLKNEYFAKFKKFKSEL